MNQYYYYPPTGQTYSADQMLSLWGINVETAAVSTINRRGFYPVQPSAPDFDTLLYTATSTWSIVPIAGGEGAIRVWTAVPKPLADAKAAGSSEAKAQANAAITSLCAECGYSNEILTAVSSQDPLDRPARYQEELDEMVAISNQLDSDLTAIDNATSVDEIDSIIQGPYGTFVSGRGGAGPLDMQPSYFTVLEKLPPGVGEPELEIFIPGTNTVIPYNAELPEPYKFDSMGNCYTGTDYRTVIRVAATGQVLSTVRPALGPAVPIEWTYNPNIPPAGGSSSSAH